MLELNPTIDHVRGEPDARLIVEYGDYECPYSPTLFIDGAVHLGAHDADTLLEALR